ncbi:MAG: hypothetical protein GWP18_01000 [Proteobacteria bacterium]|nr:hypothetical protein [Pseudomonadota bacterium]
MEKTRPVGLLYTLELPLRHPFTTSSGTVANRRLAIVALTANGVTGWGEAAPYPGQDESFASVVDGATSGVLTPTLRAAIDEASSDLHARVDGTRLTDSIPGTRSRLEMSVAVGMGDEVMPTVGSLVTSGIKRLKVKVAPGHTAHVRSIRETYPELAMGIDANGSFDSRTLDELVGLGDLGISYVEQPTENLDDPSMVELRDSGFVVLADESVRNVTDVASVLRLPGVSGIVVKPGRLGWQGSLDAVRLVRNSGKVWRASGLLESGLGRSYSEILASAEDAFMSDVASADMFFTHDIVASRSIDATITVPDGPGTGIAVDAGLIEKLSTTVVPISESVIPGLD